MQAYSSRRRLPTKQQVRWKRGTSICARESPCCARSLSTRGSLRRRRRSQRARGTTLHDRSDGSIDRAPSTNARRRPRAPAAEAPTPRGPAVTANRVRDGTRIRSARRRSPRRILTGNLAGRWRGRYGRAPRGTTAGESSAGIRFALSEGVYWRETLAWLAWLGLRWLAHLHTARRI